MKENNPIIDGRHFWYKNGIKQQEGEIDGSNIKG